MGALRVNLATAVEVTPVYSPPAVRRRVPADESRLFRALCHAAAPDFDRQVQVGVRGHPAVRHAARLRVGLRRGRRSANDGGAERSRANQDGAQWVGGKAVRGRELLGTVRSFAAGVGIHTVGVQDLAVLIVLLVDRGELRVGLGLGLVPAGQDQLAPKVLLAVELEVGRGDVRLALQIALQLQACLVGTRKTQSEEVNIQRQPRGEEVHSQQQKASAWGILLKDACAHTPKMPYVV